MYSVDLHVVNARSHLINAFSLKVGLADDAFNLIQL